MIKKVLNWLKCKMKRSKKIVLPDREEMLRRFREKDGDGHRQKYFYPLLLKQAGQRKSVEEIVRMLLCSIANYLQKIPPHAREMRTGIMFTNAGNVIDMLVEDKKIGQEVLCLLETTVEVIDAV